MPYPSQHHPLSAPTFQVPNSAQLGSVPAAVSGHQHRLCRASESSRLEDLGKKQGEGSLSGNTKAETPKQAIPLPRSWKGKHLVVSRIQHSWSSMWVQQGSLGGCPPVWLPHNSLGTSPPVSLLPSKPPPAPLHPLREVSCPASAHRCAQKELKRRGCCGRGVESSCHRDRICEHQPGLRRKSQPPPFCFSPRCSSARSPAGA